MTNIVDFGEFAPNCTGLHADLHCWLCQKNVSIRALFCHHCGTIQPVRDIDHFARLGLERRIDIDADHLERQYEALCRTLDPSRFMIRGMGERGHAAKQLEALTEAYDVLREPLRRGRYWLNLHQTEQEQAVADHPMVRELQREIEITVDPQQFDRIAARACQAMEDGIIGLMQALRGQNWQQASTTLLQLDGLEGVLNYIRNRRTAMHPKNGSHAPMTLVEAK
jgi:molecular chaperone HscB